MQFNKYKYIHTYVHTNRHTYFVWRVYVVRSFHPICVFLPCDHGLDFFYINLCENSINKKKHTYIRRVSSEVFVTSIIDPPLCVCVFSSHSFWTSSSLDVPAGVTQEEGHTGFLIHLPSAVRALTFLARRIQPFLSLVDREVEFCVLTI